MRKTKQKKSVLSLCLALVSLMAIYAGCTAIAGASAELYLSPAIKTVNIGDNFCVDALVNTSGQKVVVVAAYLRYDPTKLKVVSINTSNSVFTIEIEKIADPTTGEIKITLGKPTPGVNTTRGIVATINFEALAHASPANVSFVLSSSDATGDSDIILDDGKGTDILNSVKNGTYFIVGEKPPQNASLTYVPDDHLTIQAAVNAASAGDMIIVRDGTYNESVRVNKSLTIISENGVDSTIVQAANTTDYAFELIADYVTLSGFTIEEASDCGILISGVNNCNISNNIVSSNFQGIYLANSSRNIISNNTAKNNGYNGIYLQESNSNVIYLNNFMNNSCNVYSSNSTNIWNSTLKMTYIYNGTEYKNYLGNYWDNYTGTDNNEDGIGDTPYRIDSDKDNYPLMKTFENYFVENLSAEPLPAPALAPTPSPSPSLSPTPSATPSPTPSPTPSIAENISWAKAYGSDKTNVGINSIQQTGDGYVIAGWTGEPGHTPSSVYNKDLWVAKLDINGGIDWQRSYGESGDEEAYSILSVNGSYIVAGYKSSVNNKNVWLLKLDENGAIIWQKEIDRGDVDKAYSIKQTEDGGYIVIGETGFESSKEGRTFLDPDVWVLKLDKDVNIEWQKTYTAFSQPVSDKAYSIIQTDSGGYAFVLNMGGPVFSELSEDGNILQQFAYGKYSTEIYSIQEIDDGYVLAGWTNSFGAGEYDLWVIAINKLGSIKWQKSYGGTGDDKAYSILTTDDGYIVAGTTKSFGNGGLDAWVLKLDAEGKIQWQKSYGGSEDDEIRQILPADGGYIVSGYTRSFGFGNGDACVFKLDKNGNIGNCTMVQETNAVVTPTSAESSSWHNKKKEDTNAKVAITSSAVSDTNFQTQTICQNSKLS